MLRTLDLFCGAGGLSIGFSMAGFEPTAAVELDASSVETYSKHSPGATIYNTDVRNIEFDIFREQIDVIIGGPPCQPFSSGGLRLAEEDSRNMIPEFIRAVTAIRPIAFVMENVPGLAVGERVNYLSKVEQELSCLGYNISISVLRAEEYGVPQKRRRLFLIGMLGKKFTFPTPTHGSPNRPFVTAGDILTNEPNGAENKSKVFYAKKPDIRPSPYHGLLFNGGGRAINLSEPAPTIISSAGGNKTHFIDVHGIVPPYHQHLMSGGQAREGEVEGARRLTIKESAALQSFPEHILFSGPQSAQYRQIGNAVPPLLAKAIAAELKNQIEGKEASKRNSSDLPLQLSWI